MALGVIALSLTGLSVQARQVIGKTVAAVASMDLYEQLASQ